MSTFMWRSIQLSWRILTAALVVVAVLSGAGSASAQDKPAGVSSPSAPAAQNQMFLPVMAVNSTMDSTSGFAEDGNIDGEWSNPRNDLGQTPVTCQLIENSPVDITNENIVRYGQPIGAQDCGTPTFRSGFGFDGRDTVAFAPNQPMLLGRFTHYNNNIVTPQVPMQLVDLRVNILIPDLALDAVLTYTMRLDETLNDISPCPYGSTNEELCDDRVDFLNNTPRQIVAVNGVTYTVNILGFVPGTPDGGCQYSDSALDYFITAELAQNDACVFAEFVQPAPGINISKSPDLQQIAAGDVADFDITVTITGNVGLGDVTVADPLTPDCVREIGEMKAGASATYACTAFDVEQDFENVATVSGVFAGATYQASDSAVVDVQAPDTATISAYKYFDQNANGQRDQGEPGLSGWTLCVQDASGAPVGLCQTTDFEGRATLAPNAAGEFRVCEELQRGWVNTDPGGASACKPVTVTQAPRYIELNPIATDVYGIELTEKSSDQLTWTYVVYQFLDSRPPDAWVLALPTCIAEAQIDPAGTTTGWSFVTDSVTGLRGLRWPTTAIPVEGAAFRVAFNQVVQTGAGAAGIVAGGAAPVGATDAIAGPVCDPPVLLGNHISDAAFGSLEVRKSVLPNNDDGRFDLLIDGTAIVTDVQNGGTTGPQPVMPGVHTVAERGGTATALADYLSSLRCVETNSGSTWAPEANGEVFVDANETVVCTFTNVRRGGITIVKQVTGSAGVDWAFGGTLGAFTLPAAGGQRQFTQLAPGTYVVSETLPSGWSLAALTCVDPGADTQTNLATATATINLAPGEVVTCTFSNVGQTGSITVVKQVGGTATAPWQFTGTLGDFTLPAAGGGREFAGLAPGSYTVRELVPANWRLSSIVCADPDGGSSVDLGSGSATVDLDANDAITCTFVNEHKVPLIALEKTPSASVVYAGTDVTYSFVVSNPGEVALNNVRIDDPLCSAAPVMQGSFNVGDANSNGWLDPGESWRFACVVRITRDTTNTATAWGTAPWGEQVSAQDSAIVDVIAPEIHVDKRADRNEVAPGEQVNYRITVENTGDVPLSNVTVEDGLPECALSGPTGDNGNGVLDPSERWEYTCSMPVFTDTTNTATAEGYDPLGTRVTDTDSATVRVLRPSIDLVKTADHEYVYPGETVRFTVKVRNDGGTRLRDIEISDSLPQCRLSGPSGDDGDGELAVGEEWTYTCDITFCAGEHFPVPGLSPSGADHSKPSVCSDVTNTAYVTARDPSGQPVSDEDSVFVDLIRPDIQVIKHADKIDVHPGESVHFSMYVKNTGDVSLVDITLTDSLPECEVSGPQRSEDDEILAPGEEWLYTCTVSVYKDIVNTARAEGTDPRGTTWWDEDSVEVCIK